MSGVGSFSTYTNLAAADFENGYQYLFDFDVIISFMFFKVPREILESLSQQNSSNGLGNLC